MWLQVKVPDPAIVASLERSQATVDELQSRIAALQEENAELRSQIADLEAEQPAIPVAAAAIFVSRGQSWSLVLCWRLKGRGWVRLNAKVIHG